MDQFAQSIREIEGFITNNAFDALVSSTTNYLMEGAKKSVDHRVILKSAAKYHAIGEDEVADAYRAVSKAIGEQAADIYSSSDAKLRDMIRRLDQLINHDDLVHYLADPNKFQAHRKHLISTIVKPQLLSSNLQPSQVSYIYKSLNDFLDQFVMDVADGSLLQVRMPDLQGAADDLRGVDYEDPNWDYFDVGGDDPPSEPMPKWKEELLVFTKLVAVVCLVWVAIPTCRWELVEQVSLNWVVSEELVRRFCGWFY